MGNDYCQGKPVISNEPKCINAKNKNVNGKPILFRCNCATPNYYWIDDPKGQFGE